jgi:general L-amino acid transport system permease protein
MNQGLAPKGPKPPPRKRDWSWRSEAFRALVYQILALAVVAFALWYLASNTLANMQARGIRSGFDFLGQPAGFDIGESVIPYDALNPYWKAFLVGLANTLRVAVIGVVFATILGTLLGIGRFSRNAIVRGLCYAYVELFRNVPVLIQLLICTWSSPRCCRRSRTRLDRGDVLPQQGGDVVPDAGMGPRPGLAAAGFAVGW